MPTAKEKLIRILQNAHAGELAAAYAYRGHWKSLKESTERTQIQQIEMEEWRHRENVRRWLKDLNAKPQRLRETVFGALGKSLGALCYVSGWFLPMYFAGRLESQNVQEYVCAAGFAREIGMQNCFDEMMEMSRVERRHEEFFRKMVARHRLLPITKMLFRWS